MKVEINSTNYYLLRCKEGYLLIDCGWAGKYDEFKKQLSKMNILVGSIKYILLTHHHHDHSALVQDMRKESNCKLIVHKDGIDYLKKGNTYTRETKCYNVWLKLLDKILSPFVGDVAMNILRMFGQKVRPIEAENFDEVYKSWKKIIQCGAGTIYPAHGKSFSVEELKKCLLVESKKAI